MPPGLCNDPFFKTIYTNGKEYVVIDQGVIGGFELYLIENDLGVADIVSLHADDHVYPKWEKLT